jgi:hypothetical protein
MEALETAAYNEVVSVLGNYNMTVGEFVPHSLADDDMMLVLQAGERNTDVVPYPERDQAILDWAAAVTGEERLAASYRLQELINKAPKRIMLWYPYGYFAYNNTRYDNYSIIMGENDIFHKYSFIPNEARKAAILLLRNSTAKGTKRREKGKYTTSKSREHTQIWRNLTTKMHIEPMVRGHEGFGEKTLSTA